MKKKNLFLIVLSTIALNFLSCQKTNILDQTYTDLHTSSTANKKIITGASDKQEIISWLDLHYGNLNSKDKTTLKTLSSNLQYDKLSVVTRNNGETIIVIPIKEAAIEYFSSNADYLKLDGSAMSLIIVQGTQGKFRWSYIISHSSVEGRGLQSLSDTTIQNIINSKSVADDGTYKFINLKGKLLFQQKYKKGKLISFAKPLRKETTGNKNYGGFAKNSMSTLFSTLCHDYYLVETWFYEDGTSYQTETFLYRDCNEEQVPGGDDGGGGGNGDPEEPIDHSYTISGSLEIEETDYSEEDYYYPSPSESYFVDGEEVLPPPQLQRLKYSHPYNVTVTPLIIAKLVVVTQFTPTVEPSDQAYGGIRRIVSISDVRASYTRTPSTVDMFWAYNVLQRHYAGYVLGTPIKESFRGKTYTKIVPY